MPLDEDEIKALEEDSISFQLSGPNERMSRTDHSDGEPVSSGNSVMNSPSRKPRRRPTHKEKGKMKISEYGVALLRACMGNKAGPPGS